MPVRRTLVPLAVTAGIAWITGVLLVATQADSDPVGVRYDAANRVLTVALALLAVVAVIVARRPGVGARVRIALAVGVLLMLAGNVIEFWGALAAGTHASATAERLHEHEFAGSWPGFLLFVVGLAVATVSFALLAVRHGSGLGSLQRAVIGGGGVFMTAATVLWAVSPAAALIPAVLSAYAWLSLALAAGRDTEEASYALAAG